MPESLQGKGSTISIGTLVAALAALGGYQVQGMGEGESVSAQLAVLETKVSSMEVTLTDIKRQLEKEDVWVKHMFELQTKVGILDSRVETLEQPRSRRR